MKRSVVKKLNSVKDSIFLNLKDVSVNSGCKPEYLSGANIWILNEFYRLKLDKEAENRDALLNFIDKTLCYWYFNMIKPFIYDKEYPFRKDLFLIAAFVFDSVEKLLNDNNCEAIFQDFKELQEEVNNLWALKSKKEFAKYVVNEINQVINIIETINQELITFDIAGFFKNGIVRHIELDIDISTSKSYDEWLGLIKRMCGVSKIEINYSSNNQDKFIYKLNVKNTDALENDIIEIDKLREKILFEEERAKELLQNEGFVKKAPDEKLLEEREKVDSFGKIIVNIDLLREKYKKLLAG